MSRQSTLEEVRSWPVADQLDLVFQLWDQIVDNGWTPRPSAELEAELLRKLAAHDPDPTRALTGELVVAHVQHRVRQAF